MLEALETRIRNLGSALINALSSFKSWEAQLWFRKSDKIAKTRFQTVQFWKRTLPFHEKAGRSQELLWFGKFISNVFLCPDIRSSLAGEAAVKAERSEFILSLDGRRSRP
jgi:hypothetical protein